MIGSCNLKMSVTEECTPLKTSRNSFLRGIPDLSVTPPTSVAKPPSRNEMLRGLESEECRINDHKRIKELFTLRDEVYSTRSIKFHWNLSRCVDWCNQQNVFLKDIGNEKDGDPDSDNNNNDFEPCNETEPFSADMTSKFLYIKNSFVFVRSEAEDESLRLRIAKIIDTTSKDSVVVSLNVHWCQPYSNSNWLTSRYAPTYQEERRSRFKKLWKDEISKDSVVVTFPSLQKSSELPASVQKSIRK